MGNTVFANGMAISCKSGSGKVLGGFPDVSLSPPSPPAGPIPIPYPLFSKSSDTSSGSKKVKINKKEVMLKDKSYYKKCKGDEAATRSFGMGVVTHKLGGKVYFNSWSMDVKFEGENVVRHLDMTTSNHASPLGNESVPMTKLSIISPGIPVDCDEVKMRFPVEPHKEQQKKKDGVYKGKQSHHVIQNSHFQYPRGTTLEEICPGYDKNEAPCIPLDDGPDTSTAHGRVTQMQKGDGIRYKAEYKEGKSPTYKDARADAKKQLTENEPGPGLSPDEAECVLVEVDKYFEEACGGKKGDDLKLRPPGQHGKGLPKTSGSGTGGDF